MGMDLKDSSITVSAAIVGHDLKFINGTVTITIRDGIIESIERGAHGNIDLRGYMAMPPLSNMHTHVLDLSIAEEGWDLDIDSVVGEPYGLKYILLRKKSKTELLSAINNFIKYSHSIGVGFIAEFRELSIKGLLVDADSRPNGHFVLGMPYRSEGKRVTPDDIRELLKLSEGIGISSPLYFSDDELRTIFRITESLNKPVMSHVSETPETHEEGDLRKLISAGRPKAIVHGVWLSHDEIMLLKDKGIGIVLCPRSNLWFLAGVPKLKEIYEAGIKVAIGSDNAGWVKPDIWRDAELLYFLMRQRGVNDPKWVLHALVNADFVGINNALVEGNRANILFVKYGGTILESVRNKYVALIKRGGYELIGCLVVDGEVLYCGGGKEKTLRHGLRNCVS